MPISQQIRAAGRERDWLCLNPRFRLVRGKTGTGISHATSLGLMLLSAQHDQIPQLFFVMQTALFLPTPM